MAVDSREVEVTKEEDAYTESRDARGDELFAFSGDVGLPSADNVDCGILGDARSGDGAYIASASIWFCSSTTLPIDSPTALSVAAGAWVMLTSCMTTLSNGVCCCRCRA